MYKFNVKKHTEQCIEWIREYFATTGGETAVIGISGGKDSLITAALCCRALGKENVLGVMIPDNGKEPDMLSKSACNYLKIKNITIELNSNEVGAKFDLSAQINDQLEDAYKNNFNGLSNMTKINFPARLRMSILFAVAQSVPSGRVACTSNLSEDFVGYCTLFGDSAGQFAPLAKLTVDEVKQIGLYLGLPKEWVNVPPADGLTDKTDEEVLGFKYSDLDTFIRRKKALPDRKKLFIKKYVNNKFKTDMIKVPAYDPELPVVNIKIKPDEYLVSFEQASIFSLRLDFIRNFEDITDLDFKPNFKGYLNSTVEHISKKRANLKEKPLMVISIGSEKPDLKRNIKYVNENVFFFYNDRDNILNLVVMDPEDLRNFFCTR